MKKLIYSLQFTACSLFFACGVFASDVTMLFEQANKFYQEKEYGKAIVLYDSIVKSGYESAELYFNLGNAHFKNGDNTDAVLNYERAKKIKPNDEDTEFNLRLANLKVADKIESLPQIFFVRWWNNLVGINSSGQWAVYLVAALWAAFLLAVVFIFAGTLSLKRFSFLSAILVFLIAVLFSVFAYSQYRNEQRDVAIVFAPNVYIKSAPDEKSVDLFILHEGVRVEVKDKIGGWNKIKLADGKEGWIESEAITII